MLLNNLRSLIDVMGDISKVLQDKRILRTRNIPLSCLKKFDSNISKMDKDKIIESVLAVYDQIREDLLESEDDSWMKDNKLVVYYGMNDPKTKKLSCKLMISSFYLKALEIAKNAPPTTNTSPNSSVQKSEPSEYHIELTYYTLLVFKDCIENISEYEDDITFLSDYIEELEVELDIGDDTPSNREPGFIQLIKGMFNAPQKNGDNTNASFMDGLSKEGIIDTVGKVLGNGDVKEVLENTFDTVKKHTEDGNIDFSTIMNDLVGKIVPVSTKIIEEQNTTNKDTTSTVEVNTKESPQSVKGEKSPQTNANVIPPEGMNILNGLVEAANNMISDMGAPPPDGVHNDGSGDDRINSFMENAGKMIESVMSNVNIAHPNSGAPRDIISSNTTSNTTADNTVVDSNSNVTTNDTMVESNSNVTTNDTVVESNSNVTKVNEVDSQ